MKCPVCQVELSTDFGVDECSNCRAILLRRGGGYLCQLDKYAAANARSARRLTQHKIADKIGHTLSIYRDIEAGRLYISDERLAEIARIFGVKPLSIVLRRP